VLHVNPVSTAFAIEALDLWERHAGAEPGRPLILTMLNPLFPSAIVAQAVLPAEPREVSTFLAARSGVERQ